MLIHSVCVPNPRDQLRELKCLRTVKHIGPITRYIDEEETQNDRKVQQNAEIQMRGRWWESRRMRRWKRREKNSWGTVDRLTVAESYVNCRHVNLNHDLHLSRDDGTSPGRDYLRVGRVKIAIIIFYYDLMA